MTNLFYFSIISGCKLLLFNACAPDCIIVTTMLAVHDREITYTCTVYSKINGYIQSQLKNSASYQGIIARLG